MDLTFHTDIRVDTIEEIADLPVRNEDWAPGRGMTWAKVDGCLIFRRDGKVRTTLGREEVWELIRRSEPGHSKQPQGCVVPGWITVPMTVREPSMIASPTLTT